MRVLVTGTNRGIGLGLVKSYIERGDEVWATARQPSGAAELERLQEASGGRLTLCALDVTSDESCMELGRKLESVPLDVLINNAGVGSEFSQELERIDLRDAQRVFDINALGPLRVTRALLPSLRAARGKVVHLTSLMGSIGDNGSGRGYAYRMSKAALNMASVNLAHELGPQGILSVVVHPGWVQTEMGGPSAPTPVEQAVRHIVALIDRLSFKDNAKFFHAKGKELPW